MENTLTPAYVCSKCGLAVIILPDVKPIKACECNAPIVTNISADIYGNGGIKA